MGSDESGAGEDDSRHCVECGAPLNRYAMFCSECGTKQERSGQQPRPQGSGLVSELSLCRS